MICTDKSEKVLQLTNLQEVIFLYSINLFKGIVEKRRHFSYGRVFIKLMV